MRTLCSLALALGVLGCDGALGVDADASSPSDAGTRLDAAHPATDAHVDAPASPDALVDAWSAPIDGGHDAAIVGDAGPSSLRQTMREIGYMSAPNGFYEYLPPIYDGTTPLPLMVFWHGVGEDGNGMAAELPRVLVNGPPRLINENHWPAERPFIVLSAQNASSCPSADSIRAFLRWAFAHYPVDRARVYLTGLSCGAIGSWSYIQQYLSDGEITAAVLIAGNGRGVWPAHHCDLGSIGIWAFHGTSDGTIDPDDDMFNMMGFPTDDRPDFDQAASERAYSDWLAAGSPITDGLLHCPTAGRRDAQLTLYPGVGHDSWTRTYDGTAGHDVYSWMLSMSR